MRRTTNHNRAKLLWITSLLIILYSYSTLTDASDNVDVSAVDTPIHVNSTDRFVIGSFAVLFALCLSTLTSMIAYFVFIEDRIVRHFLSDGIQLEAKVVEYTLINARRQEYCATIDYRYNFGTMEGGGIVNDCHNMTEECVDGMDATATASTTATATANDHPNANYDNDSFRTIIRKQIKCAASDFVLHDDHDTTIRNGDASHDTNHNIPTLSKNHTMANQQLQRQSICLEIPKEIRDGAADGDKFPSFDVAIFNPLQQYYVNVVVLPEYPTSAISYQTMTQSMVQSPIIFLILFLGTLSYACIFVAITNLIAPGRGALHVSIAVKSLVVLVVFLMIEILIFHLSCYQWVCEMLNTEYRMFPYNNTPDDLYFLYKTEDETIYTMPSSLGCAATATALTMTTSTSWKPQSSPNLCSLPMTMTQAQPQPQHPYSLSSSLHQHDYGKMEELSLNR
jgi:hypothetical protein